MSFEPDLKFLIQHGLERITEIKPISDGVCVTTHCMYPSNGLVRVYVRGGVRECVATDNGEAMGEAISAGIPPTEIFDRTLSYLIRDQGVRIKDGVIFTPPVPIEAAHLAVLSVANAAKDVAQWLYDHAKVRRTRDFRALLSDFLEATFVDRVKHDEEILGAHKLHRFSNVIAFDGRKLIVDPVSPEASSINSRLVANLDVRSAADPSIIQRMVYDDEDEWSPGDLSMLEIGAIAVPFSKARDVITRIVNAG